jgi:ATP-dependent protease ClpP protease subunit
MKFTVVERDERRARLFVTDGADAAGMFAGSLAGVKADLGDAPEVDVVVNCMGGPTSPALELYDMLRERETRVHIVNGLSSGAVIALAGRTRTIERGGTILVHGAQMAVLGGATALQLALDQVNPCNERLVEILCERTGQPRSVAEEWLRRDTYFSAEQALEAGLVHEVIEPRTHVIRRGEMQLATREPEDDGAAVLLTCLDALGDIRVRDRRRFFQRLNTWFASRVKEHSAGAKGSAGFAVARPAAGLPGN